MKKYNFKNLLEIIIPILIIIFNVLIILFPSRMILTAKDGISLWINNVVPSLLPFIIGTNILMGLGVINFIGTLLEPVMYKLFRVPGIGGFALITGMTSGYPMGSKVISNIREDNLITKIEAQRLISFTNNSGPLFIIGAVGLGMFKNNYVGYFIMLIHYGAAIITGLLFRYYKPTEIRIHKTKYKNILKKSYLSMKEAKQKDGRSFGQLLGDSVGNGMQSMLHIGGFIIIFCVLVETIKLTHILSLFEIIFYFILNTFNISSELFNGFFIGIIEVTNGAKLLATENFTKPYVLAVAMLISFGGLSIHAQSVNYISKTDISIPIYFISKVIHSIITLILGLLIYPFFNFNNIEAISTFNIYTHSSIFNQLIFSSIIFILTLVFILVLGICINTAFKFNKIR